VLYLRVFLYPKASPKAISGRTSYFRVRLAFHPYPHLIHRLFNDGWFEPPLNFTLASLWTWVDHPVSGLLQRTYSRPFKTRFRCGLRFFTLTLHARSNSPVRSTKSTPSHFNRALTGCKHTVSGSISLPSRGAFHLSLTVLVHYRSLRVFSLGRWSSLIPTGFHVSRGTWDALLTYFAFRLQGCYLLWPGLSRPVRLKLLRSLLRVPQPQMHARSGLGSPRSLAATWGFSVDFCSSGY
jgi:hypothetical protein